MHTDNHPANLNHFKNRFFEAAKLKAVRILICLVSTSAFICIASQPPATQREEKPFSMPTGNEVVVLHHATEGHRCEIYNHGPQVIEAWRYLDGEPTPGKIPIPVGSIATLDNLRPKEIVKLVKVGHTDDKPTTGHTVTYKPVPADSRLHKFAIPTGAGVVILHHAIEGSSCTVYNHGPQEVEASRHLDGEAKLTKIKIPVGSTTTLDSLRAREIVTLVRVGHSPDKPTTGNSVIKLQD
jgi:hypothetical protein